MDYFYVIFMSFLLLEGFEPRWLSLYRKFFIFFCVLQQKNISYRFGKTWGWVNNVNTSHYQSKMSFVLTFPHVKRLFRTDRWLTHSSNPREAICLFPSSPVGKSAVYVDYISETRLQWMLCAWPDSVVAASVNEATSIKRIFYLHSVTKAIFPTTMDNFRMIQCWFSLLENKWKPIWFKLIRSLDNRQQ